MWMHNEAARMHDLFAGLPRAYGTYNIKRVNKAKNDKVEGLALTLQAPVTVDLWLSHLVGTQGLGIIPIRDDATCLFGAIDIDINNINHVELEKDVKKLGLPLIVCRSKSGGAHLWLFLEEPLPAMFVRSTLLNWSTMLGHPGVEVFPKQVKLANDRDVGNFINMPYFDVVNTVRYAIIDGQKASIDEFIEYAFQHTATEDDINALKTQTLNKDFADGPPCLEVLSKEKCQSGERNEGLFNFGVYARLKYGDTWDTKLQEYNTSYMAPPLPFKEVTTIIKQLQKKDYFFTCNRPPICGRCNKELCKLREFGIGQSEQEINVIVDGLTKINTSPPTWFITVDGVRMECDTDELLEQRKFRKLCLERVHKLPTMVKQPKWDRMIGKLIEHVDIIQAPEDAGPEGQLKVHIENFCMGRAAARSKDEILLGKVYFEDGFVYFRSTDLFKYLDQQHFREFKQQKVWAILRDRYEADKHEFRVKGRHVRTWRIPEFEDVQDKPFDTPQVGAPF
jgi:hypothetical protein